MIDNNNLPAGRGLYTRQMKLWQEVDSLHQEEEFMAGSALPTAERQYYGRKWTLYRRKRIVCQEVDSPQQKEDSMAANGLSITGRGYYSRK